MNYKFTAILVVLLCLIAFLLQPKKPEEKIIIPLPKPKINE